MSRAITILIVCLFLAAMLTITLASSAAAQIGKQTGPKVEYVPVYYFCTTPEHIEELAITSSPRFVRVLMIKIAKRACSSGAPQQYWIGKVIQDVKRVQDPDRKAITWAIKKVLLMVSPTEGYPGYMAKAEKTGGNQNL